MTNTIKCFPQVYKLTTMKATFIQSLPDTLNKINSPVLRFTQKPVIRFALQSSRAGVVEYFDLKQNCSEYIRLLMSRKLDSLFLCTSFSIIFSILGRIYWSIIFVIDFCLFLCIGITLTIFRTERNCPAEKDIKNITLKY